MNIPNVILEIHFVNVSVINVTVIKARNTTGPIGAEGPDLGSWSRGKKKVKWEQLYNRKNSPKF